MVRTSITISKNSKKKAEEIKSALPFLKSFVAVVEYCITRVHEEEVNQKTPRVLRRNPLRNRPKILGKRHDRGHP